MWMDEVKGSSLNNNTGILYSIVSPLKNESFLTFLHSYLTHLPLFRFGSAGSLLWSPYIIVCPGPVAAFLPPFSCHSVCLMSIWCHFRALQSGQVHFFSLMVDRISSDCVLCFCYKALFHVLMFCLVAFFPFFFQIFISLCSRSFEIFVNYESQRSEKTTGIYQAHKQSEMQQFLFRVTTNENQWTDGWRQTKDVVWNAAAHFGSSITVVRY